MGKRMWRRGNTLPESPQEAPWEGGQDGEDQMGLGTPWQPQTLEGVQVQARVASLWFRADLDADGNLMEPWPAAPSESCSRWVALSSPHSFIFIYLLIHSMSHSLSKHPVVSTLCFPSPIPTDALFLTTLFTHLAAISEHLLRARQYDRC